MDINHKDYQGFSSSLRGIGGDKLGFFVEKGCCNDEISVVFEQYFYNLYNCYCCRDVCNKIVFDTNNILNNYKNKCYNLIKLKDVHFHTYFSSNKETTPGINSLP